MLINLLQLALLSALAINRHVNGENKFTEVLKFVDDFNSFDLSKWRHDITLSGGGNWEFQWYTNNQTNSFVKNGNLFIKPSLTADDLGEKALTSQTLDLYKVPPYICTDAKFFGCVRTGTAQNILNPIKSAKITTVNSYSLRYGRVEIRAKMPSGDWLWPALWMLPKSNSYGDWPASGEIDMVELRGNRELTQNGVNIGVQQVGSTLHWGPDPQNNKFMKTHWTKNKNEGFNSGFHVYELEWNKDSIRFLIDKEEIGRVAPPNGGFWELGGFNSELKNPWAGQSKMAPFDRNFYLIINLAVGGTNGYFPDDAQNPQKKPWSNQSPTAPKDFWNARKDWLPTWDLVSSDNAALQIDYVKMYEYQYK